MDREIKKWIDKSIPVVYRCESSDCLIILVGMNQTGKGEKLTKEKVAFKTKSDIEILDDGFKWRKYGKKMVKNSPNPRNYYRCSAEGCSVKKRVERDVEDPSYVITTYEGVHNHEGPFRS
ncbi:hypothetical protein OSB04_011569 [Centaurea solstitialis]|uniref:WRKY domain-containing protein n=1 Tax=Centaurea solstitialis TaxID=347529 RepID=A0AA38WLM1_9ASTR|nr:hypothetical protein OSB04_011569 [Centaurea solstitialis]